MNKWLEDHPDTRAIRENHKRAIEENFFWYDSQLSKPRLVNEIGRRMLESQGSSVPPLRSHSQAMHEVDREYDELDGDER